MAAPPKPTKPLDRLQLMFNEILVQTGKALKTASRYGKRTIPTDNSTAEAKISASLEAYHRALDDLESEIVQAKSVLLRDLDQIRSRRAPPPPQPELRQVAPPAPMISDLDESDSPQPKPQPGSASKVVGGGGSGGGPKPGKPVAPFPNMGGFDLMTAPSAPPAASATTTTTTAATTAINTPAVPMKAAKGIPPHTMVAAAQQQKQQPGRSASAPPRKDTAKMPSSAAAGVQMARAATSAPQPASRAQPGAAGQPATPAAPPPAAGPGSMFTTMTFTLAPTSPASDPHGGPAQMVGGGRGPQPPLQQQQTLPPAAGNNMPAPAAVMDESNNIDSLLDLGGMADMGEMDYDLGGGGDGETGTFDDNFFFNEGNSGGSMGTGEFGSAYFGGM